MNLKSRIRNSIFLKVNGGALYYALLISLIVAVLSGMLILYTYIHNSYIDRQVLQEQVVSNVKSGFNLVCKNPELLNYDTHTEINLYGNNYDSVILEKRHWGVYDLIYSESNRHNYKARKIALLGDHSGKKEDIALYLADKKKYLSISGNTLLKGTCYLPKLGIKRAYIEGQGYQNRELVNGIAQQSNNELPTLIPEKLKYLENLINGTIDKSDSIIELTAQLAKNEIANSFNNNSLIVYSDEITKLQGINASGNVIFKFDNEITISANCILKDVIIIAPSVIFENDFSGQVQVLATEKIKIGNACKFKYPSFIGVLKSIPESGVSITLGKNTVLAGGVLLYSSASVSKTPLKMHIKETAEVYGIVYCNGFIQHKGAIYGSLFCEGFTLKTASSLYENHLLNATVDYSKLPSDFAGINLIEKPINLKHIKWLE